VAGHRNFLGRLLVCPRLSGGGERRAAEPQVQSERPVRAWSCLTNSNLLNNSWPPSESRPAAAAKRMRGKFTASLMGSLAPVEPGNGISKAGVSGNPSATSSIVSRTVSGSLVRRRWKLGGRMPPWRRDTHRLAERLAGFGHGAALMCSLLCRRVAPWPNSESGLCGRTAHKRKDAKCALKPLSWSRSSSRLSPSPGEIRPTGRNA